ncbi:hypothetical protein QYE76_009694 [Lolium multiflorum]|uniref:Helicase C-terminal domain-containing protein n=1 Tax=Lolium multiflorum TaxID=4521 RepID=A0AAD8TVS1_LOLMU|nr:hypothetical protein QYE76_009694 [Lolium multiflorum]
MAASFSFGSLPASTAGATPSSAAPTAGASLASPALTTALSMAGLSPPVVTAPPTNSSSSLSVLPQEELVAAAASASSSSSTAAVKTIDNDHISKYIHFKLDLAGSNYPKWKKLFHSVLFKYNAHGHVNVYTPPLEQDARWRHDDITILHWIYGTISDELYHVIATAENTAFQAWNLLNSFFGDNQSEFRSVVQGDMKISGLSLDHVDHPGHPSGDTYRPGLPEPEHMGMRKVKLLGRRRLCKLSNTSSSPCPPDAADHFIQDRIPSMATHRYYSSSLDVSGLSLDDVDHPGHPSGDTHRPGLPDFEMEAAGGSGMTLSANLEAIQLEGYNFLRMDGGTEISERERIVKDFQEGLGAQIFLLTTKVGGLGLTLTKAARVIVVDPAWNPSTDNQSVDHVYRIGQTKDVIVYRLITSATIEEKIYKLQVLKSALFRAEKNEQTRYFSQSEIQDVFSLPEQGFDVSLTQKQLQEEHGHPLEMDESLTEHIEFLEQQGIAGVSHHSLLFSKTEMLPMLSDNDALGSGADAKKTDEFFAARTNTNSDIPEEINCLTETLASAPKGEAEEGHHGPSPWAGAATNAGAPPRGEGAHDPLGHRPFAYFISRNPKVRGSIEDSHRRLLEAENTREKRALRQAEICRGGEIVAIVTVIELDFIGIIIIIISTTDTVISTAAPRLRCNI